MDSVDATDLTPDERAELTRMRAELATLRGQSEPKATRRRGRTVGVWFLIVLCAVLALLSVTTRFVRGELLDSEHYVATVAPLASDPDVQSQVADSVTTAIVTQLDLDALVASTLSELTELTPTERPRVDAALKRLAPLIAGQAESFIRSTVATVVASDQFRDLWIAANRQAHLAVVAAVTGEAQRDAVQISDDGSVSLQLAPIIETVKDQLTQRGFGFADQIPAINKEFVVFSSPQLAQAQGLIRALDTVATILPWLAIAAAAGAVAAAGRSRRWRTVCALGLAIVIAMALLALAIVLARMIYLREIPVNLISSDAARVVFDTTIGPLRIGLRATAAIGLVLAIVGFAVGRSRSASTLRSGVGKGFGAMDSLRAQRDPSPIEAWAWQARIPLRVAIVVVAAAIVMFWPYPSGMVVGWTVLIGVLALVGLEILIQPGRRGASVVPTEQPEALAADQLVDADAPAEQPAAVPAVASADTPTSGRQPE